MANWLDKYDVGGEVEGPGRTPIFKSDTLTFPAHSLARYVSDDKKSRLKGTSDNGEINKAADWLTAWFSSPGAKRRFSEGIAVKSDNFTKQALQDAKDNVNNVYVLNNYSDLIDQDLFKKYAPLINKEFEDSQKRKEEFFTSRLDDDRTNLRYAKSQAYMNELDYEIARDSGKGEGYVAGFYTPRGHMLNITKGLDVFNKDIQPGTAVHELTHASGLDDYYISFGKQILNKYPVGKSNGMGLFPMFKQPKGTTQGDKEYINHDGAYPRLMEMRYKSKINPNQVITPKQFEKIKAQNKGNDLFRYHTDHDIINMLNHFAANDNAVQSDVTQAEYGAELNYNNSTVSYPPNFVGQGYDTTGRNYSPAWGGQFAMGGSLPGAVGFTYARTGGIPDNGKYAKKTLPSAEDGIDLSFISDPKLRNTLEGNKPGLLQPGDYRLPEGRMAGSIYPSSEVSRSIGGEDGEPAYLIPSFKYGFPSQDYVGEYDETGQYLGGPFKTWQEADAFGELRHQYIDKKYKTLPSPVKTWGEGFQNGGEMKYYQEGLDWKPKSISKNGSQLTKLDQLTNFTNYNTKQSGGWLDKYND